MVPTLAGFFFPTRKNEMLLRLEGDLALLER